MLGLALTMNGAIAALWQALTPRAGRMLFLMVDVCAGDREQPTLPTGWAVRGQQRSAATRLVKL
ncbi:hypothetical protein [Nitrococcus mobilis]|uniref:Uncharacterized protein n=1 Tax=Nitrococcus mobilis Nb-231 TaxID=314278 RepID=A4BPL8_9GAMM|nr:hypothetical protein [Nitrococcus mobilis]EAR22519.1 hypothetical protein NB231_12304 [Nitrococcus mobilis Nb-231]